MCLLKHIGLLVEKLDNKNIETEKFIQTSIGLQRTPSKPIKHEPTGMVVRMQEETLTITLEYIGFGNTIKITNEQIMEKIRGLLGEVL